MSDPIGIMQGRLTASATGNLQEFPAGKWQREFAIARRIGFQSIEWLFDTPNADKNPLFSDSGRREIRDVVSETGVTVRSVCAHHFIDGQLISNDGQVRSLALATANELIVNAADVGAEAIVLPFGEGASVQDNGAMERAIDSLREISTVADRENVMLALELDVDAARAAEMMQELSLSSVGLCYDLGNATAMGFEVTQELLTIAPWLREVHVKDRPLNGPNMPLGEGSVDFLSAFSVLLSVPFKGLLTLETVKGDGPEEAGERHFQFVKNALGHARDGAVA